MGADSLRQGEHKPRLQPTPMSTEDDFRIWRSDHNGWKFELLSPRAKHWGRGNLNLDQCQTRKNVFRTNLAGINSLMHRARMAGLIQSAALREHEL